MANAQRAQLLAHADCAVVAQGTSNQRPHGIAGLRADETVRCTGHDSGVYLRFARRIAFPTDFDESEQTVVGCLTESMALVSRAMRCT